MSNREQKQNLIVWDQRKQIEICTTCQTLLLAGSAYCNLFALIPTINALAPISKRLGLTAVAAVAVGNSVSSTAQKVYKSATLPFFATLPTHLLPAEGISMQQWRSQRARAINDY